MYNANNPAKTVNTTTLCNDIIYPPYLVKHFTTKQINPINNTNGKSPGKNIINRISNSQYIKSILSFLFLHYYYSIR